ncbi:MAG: hypothetical protein WB755_25530 [Terriglobales bacterium]
MSEASRRRMRMVLAGIVIAALALIAIKHYRDTMEMPWTLVTPRQHVQTVTRMAELRNEGHFDEAIDLGLHSISGHPGDDFIYQMMATIYFVRSLHDKDQSGKWTKLGAEYSQKALASDPNDIANVFNVGMNYVMTGDDLDTDGCEYYRRAQTVFENLVPHLQGDSAETQGRTVRLAAFRRQNEEELSRVKESLRHCQQPAK